MIEKKRSDFITKEDYRKNFKRSVNFAERIYDSADQGIKEIVRKLKNNQAQLFQGQLKNFKKLLIDFNEEIGEDDENEAVDKGENYYRDFLMRMKKPLVDILASSKQYFKIPKEGVQALQRIAKDSADFHKDMLSSKQGISYTQFLYSIIFEFEIENGLRDRARIQSRSNIYDSKCTLLETLHFILEKDPTLISKNKYLCLGCWKILMLSPFKKDRYQNLRFKESHLPLLIQLSSFLKTTSGNTEIERKIDIMELIYYLYKDGHEFLDKDVEEYLYSQENKESLTFMPFPLISKEKLKGNSDSEYKPGTKKTEHECFNSREVYQGTIAQFQRDTHNMSWEYLLSPKGFKSPPFSTEWYEEVQERLKDKGESDSFEEENEDGTISGLDEYKHRLRQKTTKIRSERSSKFSVSQTSSKRMQPKKRENYKIKAIESLAIPLEIRKINLRRRTTRVLVHSLNAVYQFDSTTEGFAMYQLSRRQYDKYLKRIEELKGKGKGDDGSGDGEEEHGSGEEEDDDDDDGMVPLYR